jgi:hypothetical protein
MICKAIFWGFKFYVRSIYMRAKATEDEMKCILESVRGIGHRRFFFCCCFVLYL